MTDILIQYSALPEEVLEFSKKIVSDFNLYVVAIKQSPFRAFLTTAKEMDEIVNHILPRGEFVFTIKNPVLPAASIFDFKEKNPTLLRATLPKMSKEGLRQISLSTRTDDPESLVVWKKIAVRLKQITRTGVIVRNPETGAISQSRTFRYTSGAKSLAVTGVPMLPVAGGNILIFSELPQIVGRVELTAI